MEPWSISASLSGTLGLIMEISMTLREYSKNPYSANKDLASELMTEVVTIHRVLEWLVQFVREDKARDTVEILVPVLRGYRKRLTLIHDQLSIKPTKKKWVNSRPVNS